jgi:hypothetical protein
MKNAQDEQIAKFIQTVIEKKAAIKLGEAKPSWKTNCSFRFGENSSDSMNIQTVSDPERLIAAYAHILEREKHYTEARKALGVAGDSKFNWLGFSLEDWKHDFQTRIAKIQVAAKKKELEVLEERLNKLISPELRAKMELEEIEKLLA